MIRYLAAGSLVVAAAVIACNGKVTSGSAFGGDAPSSSGSGVGSGTLPLPAVDGGPCNPLANTSATPTTLTGLVSAGRAHDGSVYVVDSGNGVDRLFVASSGKTLAQVQDVGQAKVPNGSGGVETDISIDGATQVSVFQENGATMKMTLHTATGAEDLTLLSGNDVAGFTYVTGGKKVDLSFDAVTPDGHHIVVIEPEGATSTDEYRVFYGLPGAMVEQHATVDVDSSTLVDFELDGNDYGAYFPGGGAEPLRGTPNLRINGGTPAVQTIPLTMITPAEDFDSNGGTVYPDGGVVPFITYRDAGGVTPGSELTFTSCL